MILNYREYRDYKNCEDFYIFQILWISIYIILFCTLCYFFIKYLTIGLIKKLDKIENKSL